MIKIAKSQIPQVNDIARILKSRGVRRAGVFGSYARGEARKKSDLDILVQLKEGQSLLDLAGLEIELEKTLGRKVDLLTYDSVHPRLRKRIMQEEVKIL